MLTSLNIFLFLFMIHENGSVYIIICFISLGGSHFLFLFFMGGGGGGL